jgi:hypothetical protein
LSGRKTDSQTIKQEARSHPTPAGVGAADQIKEIKDAWDRLKPRAKVEAELRSVLASTTALIVAHRPSTVMLADRVALLEEGRITAVGTHSELLRESEHYAFVISSLEDEVRREAAEASDRIERDAASPTGYGATHDLDFDEPVYSVGLGENPESATTSLQVVFESLVTPRTVLDYDLRTRRMWKALFDDQALSSVLSPVDRELVIRWAQAVKPRVIILENVEDFQTWGPLGPDGRPDPERLGETFEKHGMVIDQQESHR